MTFFAFPAFPFTETEVQSGLNHHSFRMRSEEADVRKRALNPFKDKDMNNGAPRYNISKRVSLCPCLCLVLGPCHCHCRCHYSLCICVCVYLNSEGEWLFTIFRHKALRNVMRSQFLWYHGSTVTQYILIEFVRLIKIFTNQWGDSTEGPRWNEQSSEGVFGFAEKLGYWVGSESGGWGALRE